MVRFYLDFDGVIAHSAVECINTAFDVWIESNCDYLDRIDLVDKNEVKALVINYGISNRHLVVSPEHYYCLLDTIVDELSVGNKTLVSEHIKTVFMSKIKFTQSNILTKFKYDFFSFRNKKSAMKTDAEWVEENPPTSFTGQFFDLINKHSSEVTVVSRKNYHAIAKWCQGSKLPIDKICGDEVLSQFNNSKFDLIKSIQKKNGYLESFFIDDSVREFESLDWKEIGVTALVAGWGYNDLTDNTQLVLNKIKGHLHDLHY